MFTQSFTIFVFYFNFSFIFLLYRPVWKKISKEAKDLISRMLVVDPNYRLSASGKLRKACLSCFYVRNRVLFDHLNPCYSMPINRVQSAPVDHRHGTHRRAPGPLGGCSTQHEAPNGEEKSCCEIKLNAPTIFPIKYPVMDDVFSYSSVSFLFCVKMFVCFNSGLNRK